MQAGSVISPTATQDIAARLAASLGDCAAALADLRSGFPTGELHKSLEEIEEEAEAALSAYYSPDTQAEGRT